MKIRDITHTIEYLDDGYRILQRLERIGRVCYKSEDKISAGSAGRFVQSIIANGHHSVLEHVSMTVRFICDRGVSHELVRHRLCAYSQESTRYCNYSKDGLELVPMLDCLDDEQMRRRLAFYEYAEWLYNAEISEGIKPEQARDNLPICTKTEIVHTANLREWRHILSIRTSHKTHPQIRRMMAGLLAEAKSRVQVVFDDIEVT